MGSAKDMRQLSRYEEQHCKRNSFAIPFRCQFIKFVADFLKFSPCFDQ